MIASTKFKKHQEYLDVLLVLVIFAAALAVRAFWIEHPALWVDEIFTVVYARQVH